MKVWLLSVVTFLSLVHLSAVAQSQAEQQDAALQVADGALKQTQQQSQTSEKSPLTELGDEYTNSIELLRNRFRVDYNVEEVTMVFFREYGSAPVVLVRPDGSKLFLDRTGDKQVEWYDSETFDMIKIKNPMPGPWQAVGQVLEGSRVMVLSNLELHAEPLPQLLFSGEILKSTAYLTNNGKPIQNKLFRDVVELDIEFKSTNNPNFDNFGAGDQDIATFQDDGRGMDERPTDGVFTGQFNLKVAPGEWKPVFRVKTPMFTREQEGQLIILHENPVNVSVELSGGGEGYHKIIIDVNRDVVDIESLLIDGKVRFPNADMQNFSLTEGGSEAREHLILAYEPGIFRVKLTAYGTTSDGRDFILDVPEYSFLSEQNNEIVIDDPLVDEDPQSQDEMTTTSDELSFSSTPELAEDEQLDSGTLTLILVAVNGSIVLIGAGVAVFIIWRRKRANKPKTPKAPAKSPAAKEQPSDAGLTMEQEPKGIKKLFAKFKKKGK
ncbi:TIGR03503 family protein [Alteromonas sp. D210916BOD_24]